MGAVRGPLGTCTLLLVDGRTQGQPGHWCGPWQGTSAFLRDATMTSCLVVEAKLGEEEKTSVKPSSASLQP